MNYDHAFHAGNHADILKHWVFSFALERMARKASPFAVLDTHAGAGSFDLADERAQRSPEWRDGIGRLWDWTEAPAALAPFLALVREVNADGSLTRYPGSPQIALALMRPQDRLMVCEKHPAAFAALARATRGDRRVQRHERCGHGAATALLPPPERRGIVLIDPPYEAPDEFERSVATLAAAVERFAHGVFIWWRPLKHAGAVRAADAEIASFAGVERLRADLCVGAITADGKLAGSSVLVLNPPFGLAEALRAGLPSLTARLAQDAGASWQVSTAGV